MAAESTTRFESRYMALAKLYCVTFLWENKRKQPGGGREDWSLRISFNKVQTWIMLFKIISIFDPSKTESWANSGSVQVKTF